MSRRFIAVQSAHDQKLQNEYKVYLRTCRVVDMSLPSAAPTRVIASGLHPLDAQRLKLLLNEAPERAAETAATFAPNWGNSGHTDAQELLSIVSRYSL